MIHNTENVMTKYRKAILRLDILPTVNIFFSSDVHHEPILDNTDLNS